MPAYWAYGTQLQLGNGADPEVFSEIARVTDIRGPGIVQSFDEITAHDGPDRFRQFMATLLEMTEVEFDIIWDPADPTHDNTSGLMAEILNGNLANYRAVFPTTPAVGWEIPAFVQEFSPVEPVDGALRATITLKPSGAPDFAPVLA